MEDKEGTYTNGALECARNERTHWKDDERF